MLNGCGSNSGVTLAHFHFTQWVQVPILGVKWTLGFLVVGGGVYATVAEWLTSVLSLQFLTLTLSSLSVSPPPPPPHTLTLSLSTYPHSLPIHPLLHSFSILTLLYTHTHMSHLHSLPHPHTVWLQVGGFLVKRKCISVESRDYCNTGP